MKKCSIILLLFAAFFELTTAQNLLFMEMNPDGFSAGGNLDLQKKGLVKLRSFADGEPEFWQKLTDEICREPVFSGKNDVLFFMHGMRGDREPFFSEVMRQMKSDYLDRADCPIRLIVCLRWKPGKRGYRAISREAAPVLADHFEGVLQKIIDLEWQVGRSAGTKFHLLGNSMATRIFTLAVQKMEPLPTGQPAFSNLIFGAPDLETGRFSDHLVMDKFPELATRTTFFFNQNDRALRYCEWKNRQPMLGKSGPETSCKPPENVHFFEITGAVNRTFAGRFSQHTYFSHSPQVVKKIALIFQGR